MEGIDNMELLHSQVKIQLHTNSHTTSIVILSLYSFSFGSRYQNDTEQVACGVRILIGGSQFPLELERGEKARDTD